MSDAVVLILYWLNLFKCHFKIIVVSGLRVALQRRCLYQNGGLYCFEAIKFVVFCFCTVVGLTPLKFVVITSCN